MDLRDEFADGSIEEGRDCRRKHESGSETPPLNLKTHDAARIWVDVHGSGCGLWCSIENKSFGHQGWRRQRE